MRNLHDICIHYGTDKATHGFDDFYQITFDHLRERITKVLEIGVRSGASLLAWQEFFPNAQIHGIDLATTNQLLGSRIAEHICDQESRFQLNELINRIGGEFDIIIDDGGHTMPQQQISLGFLLPHVKPGGYYIIEDLHTSFMPSIKIMSYGKEISRYSTHIDSCKHTTYDLVERLTHKQPILSYYLSPPENDYLNAHVASAIIFDKNNDKKHITSLLHKTS